MRSNKGITLTSLIIYIIVFSIVIGTVATLSGYFVNNVDEIVVSTDLSDQYTRLTTYLNNDINSINFLSLEVIEEEDNYCININFIDGLSHRYLYDDKKIYFISQKETTVEKKITLCSKLEGCIFEQDLEKDKLKISITIDGITYNNIYSI